MTEIKEKRQFRYAAGYMIEQEGSGIVERLVRDGTYSKFGVRQSWVPNTNLENLTRPQAENLLETSQWRFRNYHKIQETFTPSAKIFDTQILFSPEVAIGQAKQALLEIGYDRIEENGRLDALTRDILEIADPNEFLSQYVTELENFVIENYDGRKSLVKRVTNKPYKNVDTSPTTL